VKSLFTAFLLALGLVFYLAPNRAETIVGTTDDDGAKSAAHVSNSTSTTTTISTASKAEATPHFWQRDSRGGFANGGRDYCSPVAVSNSLVYLARNGFPALLSDGEGDQPQIDLINVLASSDYFGTNPTSGTSPGEILSGVQKYVEEKGYSCARLEYEGWRGVGRHDVMARRVHPDWLAEGINDPHGAVWLNVGWYTQGDAPGEWKRTGGHWVTLVGTGDDAQTLVIHNPLRRNDDDPASDTINLEPMSEGTLLTGGKSTGDAAGMYRVSGPGLPLASGVDAAFLDDAIVLVVGR
jgi:hypothetical protein